MRAKKNCEWVLKLFPEPSKPTHYKLSTRKAEADFSKWKVLSLSERNAWRRRQLKMPMPYRIGYHLDPGPGVQPYVWSLDWSPVMVSEEGDYLAIDNDPALGGKKGQIIVVWHNDPMRWVVTPNIEALERQVGQVVDLQPPRPPQTRRERKHARKWATAREEQRRAGGKAKSNSRRKAAANPAPFTHAMPVPSNLEPVRNLFGEWLPKRSETLVTGDAVRKSDGRVYIFVGTDERGKPWLVSQREWNAREDTLRAELNRMRHRLQTGFQSHTAKKERKMRRRAAELNIQQKGLKNSWAGRARHNGVERFKVTTASDKMCDRITSAGWIDPQGQIYDLSRGSSYFSHHDFENEMREEGVVHLLGKGWMAVHTVRGHATVKVNNPTEVQLRALCSLLFDCLMRRIQQMPRFSRRGVIDPDERVIVWQDTPTGEKSQKFGVLEFIERNAPDLAAELLDPQRAWANESKAWPRKQVTLQGKTWTIFKLPRQGDVYLLFLGAYGPGRDGLPRNPGTLDGIQFEVVNNRVRMPDDPVRGWRNLLVHDFRLISEFDFLEMERGSQKAKKEVMKQWWGLLERLRVELQQRMNARVRV